MCTGDSRQVLISAADGNKPPEIEKKKHRQQQHQEPYKAGIQTPFSSYDQG